jgi:ERO1-like protein alpha
VKNPERNTGYKGGPIWEAMYNENCFETTKKKHPLGFTFSKDLQKEQDMCFEERVLYRLLSGMQTSTAISIDYE